MNNLEAASILDQISEGIQTTIIKLAIQMGKEALIEAENLKRMKTVSTDPNNKRT